MQLNGQCHNKGMKIASAENITRLAKCQLFCTINKGCKYYNYDYKAQTCWLYDSDTINCESMITPRNFDKNVCDWSVTSTSLEPSISSTDALHSSNERTEPKPLKKIVKTKIRKKSTTQGLQTEMEHTTSPSDQLKQNKTKKSVSKHLKQLVPSLNLEKFLIPRSLHSEKKSTTRSVERNHDQETETTLDNHEEGEKRTVLSDEGQKMTSNVFNETFFTKVALNKTATTLPSMENVPTTVTEDITIRLQISLESSSNKTTTKTIGELDWDDTILPKISTKTSNVTSKTSSEPDWDDTVSTPKTALKNKTTTEPDWDDTGMPEHEGQSSKKSTTENNQLSTTTKIKKRGSEQSTKTLETNTETTMTENVTPSDNHTDIRCQFNQRFTSSFYGHRSQKRKKTLINYLTVFSAFGICAHKSFT